ncbi:hypothetical protein Pla123a_06650 [Posidoniimonas polymericola]|uniref:DUF4190 domain-containing protein n=1 Tax=Posidoniimonas polymericola TaxID=2528002 RepID=A0A5C5ZFA0_9BACT|nr:hypothetical protein [Posidoniimonas polymericola]TWT85858.1 hypothetical protein Pla123a_06650 [Posidoniimonas polymericola]
MTTDHDDFSTEETYRTLSAAAVLSLVLGLLSPGLFLWPLLVVLPCLAIATALIALHRISVADAAGRGLALAGLGLGVMCLSSWGGYKLAYDTRLHAQAAPTAELMLKLLGEGDKQNAFLLSKNAKDRPAVAEYFLQPEATRQADAEQAATGSDGSPPQAAPSTPDADLVQFLERPEIQQLIEIGPFESIKRVSSGSIYSSSNRRATLSQTYEVRPEQGPTRRYMITLDRTSVGSAPPVWRVIGVGLDEG